MAIKIGDNTTVFKVGSDDCKIYLGNTLLYSPTPPVFQGKWLATYTGGTVSSAECDSTSAITSNEITLGGLVDVQIGHCVTSISQMAFRYCSSLKSVTIPNSVTSIGSNAFQYCSSLTSIDIPNGVTSIGSYAFNNCTSLRSITIEATTPPTISNFGVFNNTNNCPIYVPSDSVDAYKAATNWSNYAERIFAIQ